MTDLVDTFSAEALEPTERRIWDNMRRAVSTATKSPDLSTQNGAVLVGRDGGVIGMGSNRPPAGVTARLERPEKYAFTEHAERNAIFAAARFGHSTQDAVMFALWAACADCGRAIIEAGIRKVYTLAFYPEQMNAEVDGRWADSIGDTGVMFEEAGIELEFWTPPAPLMASYTEAPAIAEGLRFNGELVHY